MENTARKNDEMRTSGKTRGRANKLVLDCGKLIRNYLKLSGYVGGRAVCVVKANAYGHGAVPVVRALYAAGARLFAVANVREGVAVKRALKGDASVFVLGYVSDGELKAAEKYALVVPVFSKESCELLIASGRKLNCYIQIDTGMNRLGLNSENVAEIERVTRAINGRGGLTLKAVGSHLFAAENDETSLVQAKNFTRSTENLSLPKSLCSSEAACKNLVEGEYVRLGICLYGYGSLASRLKLEKPLALYSRVVRIKRLLRGETAGYNAVFTAETDTFVGTVPLGYADGIMRSYLGASVFVRGRKCRIVAVCMDMIMIELPPSAKLFDEVIVFSEEGNLTSLAERAKTIVYESLTALNVRGERVTVNAPPTKKPR